MYLLACVGINVLSAGVSRSSILREFMCTLNMLNGGEHLQTHMHLPVPVHCYSYIYQIVVC